MEPSLQDLADRMDRIESLLATLVQALAEEDDDLHSLTLDGHSAGQERDQNQPL